MREITFKVVGAGPFPIDMLRYDNAFPSSESESAKILDDDKKREVSLTARVATAREAAFVPTSARWDSFTWGVVRDSRTEVA